MSDITIVFGGGAFSPTHHTFNNKEDVVTVLDALEAGGVKHIDSAHMYTGSEQLLGEANAASKFVIDTKNPGGARHVQGNAGALSAKELYESLEGSLERLHTKKVDIFYIHAPDPHTPVSETCEGMNELHKAGLISRFGLSNFSVAQVREVYDYSKAHGLILPTVYQGNYNAASRQKEHDLFPTLRELGISFYVYSPLAGGFFAKTKQQVLDGAGRFNQNAIMGMYKFLYARPKLLDALEKWSEISKEAGCSPTTLAHRWLMYNSALKAGKGDGIIIGASSVEQLKKTLDDFKGGPLDAKTAKAIDAWWESIKDEAPDNNFEFFSQK